jgi:RNA-directed DNA polymerase
MPIANRHYAQDQSPLYMVTSPRKLAGVLGLELVDLEKLASGGTNNYRQYWAKTKTGKAPRRIETPKPDLHRVQRRIHDLLAKITPPDYIFSGFPRRSAVQNAERHSLVARVVKLDITSFYPSADGSRIASFFRKEMYCQPDVAAILMKLTAMPATEVFDHPHLPTGGVTSPILAYYAYRQMFEDLNALALENGLRMTVMVDDITFSGEKADHELKKRARHILFRYGLQSKRSKEKVFAADRNKIITGVVLTKNGPRLPNERRQRIDHLWREIGTDQKPIERARLYQKLSGAAFSAAQIEPQFQAQGRTAQQIWRKDKPAWRARRALSKKPPQSRRKLARRRQGKIVAEGANLDT